MTRLLIATFICAAACDHDELDFTLPDTGRDDQREAVGQRGSDSCAETGSCVDAPDGWGSQSMAVAGSGSATGGAGGAGVGSTDMSAGSRSAAHPQRFQDDPNGYPGGPEQRAAWCDQGQSFEEICGNDIDEDCDGTVDEYPGIGTPCVSGCGEGRYVCSASMNALLCLGLQGCANPQRQTCGDGFVNHGEECDPNADFEMADITCTLTCERPLFVVCVERGMVHSERCDELRVCNERIGACVPIIGPGQPRCPELPIEGSEARDEFYPMLETEDGECWVTCSESEQCPSSLSECYMGFCAVPF